MEERSHTDLSLKMILKAATTRIIITITIITISFILKNRRIAHRNFNVDVRNEMATIDTIQVGFVVSLLELDRYFVCLDVRQEAVKQALEQFGARPIPSSKRIHQPAARRKISRTNEGIDHMPFLDRFQMHRQKRMTTMMMKAVPLMVRPLMTNTRRNRRYHPHR